MKFDSNSAVATALVVVFALVGGALVIVSAIGHVDPAVRLTFDEYLKAMAVAVGGLAIGRGLHPRSKP